MEPATPTRRRVAPRNFALRDLVDDVEDDDMALPTPPSTRGTKKRGSDTARKDRSDLLKAYLLEIGVIRIRGARRRRNNDDGSPAGGKIDWDSEFVQQTLTIPTLEFEAIRLDYERRSERKRLNDQTIERDWTTDGCVRRPAAKMLKNFYPTNLILHRFFDIVVNGLMKDRHVSPSRLAELSAIDPFLKCRPLALVLLPDLEEDASGELGGAVDLNNGQPNGSSAVNGSASGAGATRQGLHLYPLRGPRSETSRLEFVCDGDVIVIETYKVFDDQLSLIGRPGFQHITYIDDMLAPDVAPHVRNADDFRALWNSAFSRNGQDPSTLHEVEEKHFLSCFREALRPTLRYLFFAPHPNKSTVTVSEFCHFMEWAAALASQEDAEHAVADQLRALVQALQFEEPSSGGLPYSREPLALFATGGAQSKPRSPLKRPGDFFLHADRSAPSALLLEFMGNDESVAQGQLDLAFHEGHIQFRDPNTQKTYTTLGHALVQTLGVDHYTRLHQVCDTPAHMLLMRSDPSASSSSTSANGGSSKGKRKHAGDKNSSDSPKRLALSVNETANSSSFTSASDSLLSASRSTRSRNSLHFFGSSPEPSPGGPSSSLHHHALHNNHHLHHQPAYHPSHFPHSHQPHTGGHVHVVTNAYAPHQPSLLHPHLHLPAANMPKAPPLHQPSSSQAPPLSFMGSAGDIHSLLLHPVNTLAGDSLFGDLPVPSDSFADTIGLSQLDLESPNGDGHGIKPLAWPSSDDIMNDPNVYNLIVNLAP